MSETDYMAVCTVFDEEDFGVNFYSGTVVIDGTTREWNATEDPERKWYAGRLKVNGVAIRKRKDYLAIHEAVNKAVQETRELYVQPHPPQPTQQTQPSTQPSEIVFEDEGLTMEDILGQ